MHGIFKNRNKFSNEMEWYVNGYNKSAPNLSGANNLKPHTCMHLLIPPMLGSLIWVGGGSVGLILLIVVIVLLVR
jgi:hypothetical protein